MIDTVFLRGSLFKTKITQTQRAFQTFRIQRTNSGAGSSGRACRGARLQGLRGLALPPGCPCCPCPSAPISFARHPGATPRAPLVLPQLVLLPAPLPAGSPSCQVACALIPQVPAQTSPHQDGGDEVCVPLRSQRLGQRPAQGKRARNTC